MKKIFVMFALGLLVLATSCDTLNIGNTGDPVRGPVVTVTVPADMTGMLTYNWTASWPATTGPYTISWNFGAGAPAIPTAAGVSPVTAAVTMNDQAAPATFAYTVTVTDGDNLSGTAEGNYTVGTTLNMPPSITSMVVAGNVLTVTTDDADDDPVAVTVSGFTGMSVDAATKTAAAVGTTVFTFSADDIVAGASSTVDVTTDDGKGGSDTGTTTDPVVIAPFVAAADTLYAIPNVTSAAVGDPVTILVYTGATANGFQFMLNVGLVFPSDATYVSKTFNVGAVGGDTDDADGLWAAITTDGGFILGPDSLIKPGANPEDTLGTNNRFDFNVSPLGGTDQASVTGELFNAQFSFGTAGTKTVTFQEFNGVDRTYYNDKASETTTYNWGSYVDGVIEVS